MKLGNEEQDINNDLKIAEVSQAEHLAKFKNMDVLFEITDHLVQSYFKEQNEFPDLETFKKSMELRLQYYVISFNLNRAERTKMRPKLKFIEEKYSEIIYFGEGNPVKKRENGVSESVGGQVGEYVGKVGDIL